MLLKIDPSGIRVVVDAVRNKIYQIDEIDLEGASFNILTRKVTAEVGEGAPLEPLLDRVTVAEDTLSEVNASIGTVNTRIDDVGDYIAILEARQDALEITGTLIITVDNNGERVVDNEDNVVVA